MMGRSEKTSEAVKAVLKEITPRFGLSSSIQSDNGSAFIATVTQKVPQRSEMQKKFHASWRPQCTGKSEKAHHTLYLC